MKKIKIVKQNIKPKWYVKLFIVGLSCILILMVIVLVKFYFDVNNRSSGDTVTDGNIIADFDIVKNNYTIFRNGDGFSGVKDINDRYVIEPRWNNVFFLNDGRFAVQQKNGEKLLIAVIDSEENFITPFIFEKLVSVGNNFIVAYFNNQNGFALLDTKGNIISDKMWTSFEYDEKNEYITLKRDYDSYQYKYENDIIQCVGVNFKARINNCEVVYNSDNLKMIKDISPDKMYNIFNSACIYFSSLILGNMDDISAVTDEQYLESVSTNNIFKNCTIKSIKNLTIDISEYESKGYTFSAEISYDYQDEIKLITNLNSLVSLNFIDNENNVVVLKSMNKKEF